MTLSRDPAAWLGLAAAPTFAAMALLTGLLGPDMADLMCGAGGDRWRLDGMVPMYALMSLFHSTPWLKLMRERHRAVRA